MRHQNITIRIVMVLSVSVLVVSVVLAAQSWDRFTLKSANGIALSEFRGYDEWQLIVTLVGPVLRNNFGVDETS